MKLGWLWVILIILAAVVVFVILKYSTISCDYEDTSKRYEAKSKYVCSTIRYFCNPGEEYFGDRCGCGCILSP